MLNDNIPVFTDLAYRTSATFNLYQFEKILKCSFVEDKKKYDTSADINKWDEKRYGKFKIRKK